MSDYYNFVTFKYIHSFNGGIAHSGGNNNGFNAQFVGARFSQGQRLLGGFIAAGLFKVDSLEFHISPYFRYFVYSLILPVGQCQPPPPPTQVKALRRWS